MQAEGEKVLVADLVAIGDIGEVAVAPLVAERRFHRDIVEFAEVEQSVEGLAIKTTDTQAHAAAELACRLLSYDMDQAANGIFAEQRALRSAQYLNALDIQGLEDGAVRAAHEHAVDHDADGRIEGFLDVLKADAAQGNGGVIGAAGADLIEDDIGDGVLHVANVLEKSALDHVLRDGGDRRRHVLKVFFPLARGDRDFFQTAARARIVLRPDRKGR